ncbi:MAG: hypothetical protein HYW56_01005 [Candidatus Harrisonbacteria bacterium]|nr:hypothetical protein [Candidatus Harrisonbacteria bacterium]
MPPKPKMVKEPPKLKGKGPWMTPSGFFTAITVLILAFFPLLPRLLGGVADVKERMFWLLGILRPIIIALDVLGIAFFIFLLTKIWPLQWRPTLFHKRHKKEERKKDPVFVARWADIVGKAAIGTAESLRLAVIDADALVDAALKQSGYEGENMAERLARVLPSEVKSVEGVWAAHRLRNDLVHTPGYELKPEEGKVAVEMYELFLKEVSIL